MRTYLIYGDGKISELGATNLDGIDDLLTRAENSLAEPDAERQFGVGLCRSDRDYVQVAPIGEDGYLLWSDRIVKKGGFLGFFASSKPINPILKGRAAALEALRAYGGLSREGFEALYG